MPGPTISAAAATQLQLRFRSDGHRSSGVVNNDDSATAAATTAATAAAAANQIYERTGFKASYQFLPMRKQFQGGSQTCKKE